MTPDQQRRVDDLRSEAQRHRHHARTLDAMAANIEAGKPAWGPA